MHGQQNIKKMKRNVSKLTLLKPQKYATNIYPPNFEKKKSSTSIEPHCRNKTSKQNYLQITKNGV